MAISAKDVMELRRQTDCGMMECKKALTQAEGDFEKAEQLHKDASDALIGAHDTQTKLLSQEAGGGEMEMTFIMAHAQDTLMTTMILEKQTRFTIDAYKRIAELEAKLA